ncbi:hypothetical protein GGH92_008903, partial [Coemansia sp. RSA 2673]
MSTPSPQDQAPGKRSRAESPVAQQPAASAEDVASKRAKNEEEEEHHFLRESDVGITQFVTLGWDGFD